MSGESSSDEIKRDYVAKMGDQLGPLYYFLWSECTVLHIDWMEFKELFGTSEDRLALLNERTGSFFGMCQRIFWDMTLLRIARLMDPARSSGKNKENASLPALELLVDQSIRSRLKALVEEARVRCSFAKDWRNRRIAHRDLLVALRAPSTQLASASRSSVDEALASISAALNIVEFHYCGATVAYEHSISSVHGAKSLLLTIRDGVEARRRAKERLRRGEATREDLAEMRRPI